MEKGTTSLLVATAVITVAIIGGIYLSDRAQRSAQQGASEEGGWTTLFSSFFSGNTDSSPTSQGTPSSPSSQNGQSSLSPSSRKWRSYYPGPTNTQNVSPETPRTEQILTCNHPEYGTFYTNAASCEEADLHNRLTITEPLEQIPGQGLYNEDSYPAPQDAASNSRINPQQTSEKPNLRLHAKSPPSGLNVSCKFAVGKALEIERTLAAATVDPRRSAWRDSYCKQRCEAIKEACPVADDYFYYRYGDICPGSDFYPCFPENP